MTFGQSGMIHPSLASMVDAIKGEISRVALHRKFTKAAADFLEKCLNFVLKQKITDSFPVLDIKLLNHFKRVMIIDSSSWDINSKLKNVFPGSGGCASSANCKLQLCYEYLKGTFSFFDITPGKRPDNSYTHHIPEKIKSNDLILSDLGYFCLKTFLAIINKKAFFFSRFSVGTILYHKSDNSSLDLVKYLKKIKNNIHEMPVKIGKNIKIPCRFICIRANEQIANERRRKMIKEANKKGRTPSKLNLVLAGWTLMVTNIPQKQLPPKAALSLYALRWQIELIFKQIKSVLRIHKSNTGNEFRMKCEVYGKLIMAILIHRIHSDINVNLWNNKKRELSMEKLYKRFQERAFLIMQLFRISFRKVLSYLKQVIPKLINNCLKNKQNSRKTTLEKLYILETDKNVSLCF